VPQVDYLRTATRPAWDDLPEQARACVAEAAGSAVVHVDAPPTTGFSNAFAAGLVLADGRRVFTKVGWPMNSWTLDAVAAEAAALATMPAAVPAARLVGSAETDGPGGTWSALVTTWRPGRPPVPWTAPALDAVHDACLATADALTPAPPGLGPALGTVSAQGFGGWFGRLADGEVPPAWGQPSWLPDRARDLQSLVAVADDAVDGRTGVHGDLRADNLLVDLGGPHREATVTIVDWNWLGRGPVWFDLVGLLPPARADGVDVDALVARSPLTAGADPDAVDAFLAAVAAFMLEQADEPVFAGGPPVLRVHQRRYARLFLDWLGARRGWA
jgi:hypothetical protein